MNELNKNRRDLLNFMQKKIEEGAGEDRKQRQHKEGKYTAKERVLKLLDTGSFVEIDQFVKHSCHYFGIDKQKYLGDGVIVGIGKINGRDVAVYSQDFTCWGGALGIAHAKKICKVMDLALENKMPVIGISDSGGARIQEGVESLAGYADIFYRNVQASGVIPQISLILGPCAGGAVYSPALTDFIFMVDKISNMFVTGPEVIKAVTHEVVDKEKLGGAATHNQISGVGHFKCNNEDDCFEKVRELFEFIPSSFENSKIEKSLHESSTDSVFRDCAKLKDLIPENSKKPYDIKDIIYEVVDNNHFFEIQKDYAQNIVCGFAKIGSINIGIVANQPAVLAGVLDINSSLKAARFIRFCDAFNISIVTFVDVPGFLPGTQQEYGGIIKHGSKLLYAYCEATVPLITVVTRKAYGGAYDVMASKHIGADINLAYPTAEIAVMGAEGAVNIIFRNQLKGLSGEELEKKRAELVKTYEDEFNNPYKAAELGYIDEVIYPEDTRKKIYSYLKILKNKSKKRPTRKHGNIQL